MRQSVSERRTDGARERPIHPEFSLTLLCSVRGGSETSPESLSARDRPWLIPTMPQILQRRKRDLAGALPWLELLHGKQCGART
jgi:hypothetical protein